MIEHLAVSTVILGIAMLAGRLLPVTARTRHAILLCAVAKFAVPTTLLDNAGLKVVRIAPMPLRVFDGTTNSPLPAPAAMPKWLLIVWAAIAMMLIARWLLLRSRTLSAALRSPARPSQREIEALAEARRILGLRTAVDIVRSPVCEAPAVLRVVRPVIVLPANGCDELTEEELRALLLHELAHVARRDNLTAIFGALAGALFWFHPLVWLALRQIEGAREQACDERVSESMNQVDSYLEALTKICRALIAPRTAGASCMAGANVKERMEHLMAYERLRSRAWSHRGVVAMAAIVVIAATAIAATPPANEELYKLDYMFSTYPDRVVFDLTLTEIATGQQGKAKISARHGEWATMVGGPGGEDVKVEIRKTEGGPVEAILTVTRNGKELQKDVYKRDLASEFSGEPIDLHVKGADIRDLMKTLSEITGTTIAVAPDVDALVTIDVDNMPWDQVLMEVAKMTGTRITIEGKTINVTK